MKNIFLAFILMLAGLCPAALAQPSGSISPTTEEEYVMGSVGYKMFMQLRVELKPGYKVNDIRDFEYGERKASFKGLYRSGEKTPCAIILVYTKLRGAPELLWDRFRNSLAGETDNKQEQLQFFGFALAKAMMLYAGE